jgi:predicted phosphodiesterase
MRIGIFADVHGNLAALDAVLAALAAEGIDRLVCLGDVAASGPQPREVVARLRQLGCPIVLGNADAWLLDPPPPGTGDDEDAARIEAIDRWCAEQLRPADLAFLRTFRPTVAVPLDDGADLLCYHGSPRGYDDVIKATTPDEELAAMLAGHRATVMAGGHWHFQLLRRYEGAILLNPGSVGLAYDLLPGGEARVPPRAEYALLSSHGAALAIELRRLPYDRDATVRAMFERGMPHAAWWSESWLG